MKKRKRGRPLGVKNKDKQLISLTDIEPEKAKLIKEIWELQPDTKTLGVDLTKYTIEQLQKHIERIKEKNQ